jgi:surface antigen
MSAAVAGGRAAKIALMTAAFVVAVVPAAAAMVVPAAKAVPSSVLCSGYVGCNRNGYSSYEYGRHSQTSYWRMSPGDECTNYVAYAESQAFGVRTPRYSLGNAYQWPASAVAHGVRVNRIPSVGAVAVWSGSAYGIGPMGHVAVVEQVGPHDSYIVVSQQHLLNAANGYEWTRISAGFPADTWQPWPSLFIHFPITRLPPRL